MFEFLDTFSGEYQIAKFILLKGLAVIYLIAFLNAFNQFPALLGEQGLLPLPSYMSRFKLKNRPTLFQWKYSDRLFRLIACTGILFSLIALSGLADKASIWVHILIWIALWAMYLSIVNAGLIFYGFGWESMLLEAGFYAIFLGPLSWQAPIPVIWIYCWMVFRVEFGAGLIKMRGDECWRKLTCLNYHHETQPLPNTLSWYFHHLPKPLHKIETLGNHIVQLVLVWGLFFPQPVASVSAGAIILSQSYLIISGNYSWLNWMTIVLAFSGIHDGTFGILFGWVPGEAVPLPISYELVIISLAFVVVYLSINPVINMISSRQKMNASFNPLHLVNTYGAFGTVSRKRYEIIIEGTRDRKLNQTTEWKEYEFKGKPGDLSRRPPIVSPYHHRLDWQMWFAAMSTHPQRHPWFLPLVQKLLQNDKQILGLFRKNPFPKDPPLYIRARLFRYEFTEVEERRESGNWWKREFVQEYMKPKSLRESLHSGF